jgi:hypothetical protein
LGETERDEASERQRGAAGISARRSRDGDRQDGERHGERETERGTLVLGRRHCERETERVRRRSRDGARHGERETKRGMASGRRSEACRFWIGVSASGRRRECESEKLFERVRELLNELFCGEVYPSAVLAAKKLKSTTETLSSLILNERSDDGFLCISSFHLFFFFTGILYSYASDFCTK